MAGAGAQSADRFLSAICFDKALSRPISFERHRGSSSFCGRDQQECFPPKSASRETEICDQRLSAECAFDECLRPPIGDRRPESLALSGGNVGRFRTLRNYASSVRLGGGARRIRTDDLFNVTVGNVLLLGFSEYAHNLEIPCASHRPPQRAQLNSAEPNSV